MEHLNSLIAVLIMITAYYFGGRFVNSKSADRKILVSVAAGISVAYIFVSLLPELSDAQEFYNNNKNEKAFELQNILIYLTALAGFLFFFGLENYIISKRDAEHEENQKHFNINMVTGVYLTGFLINNFLISYLIVFWGNSNTALFFYTIAMSVHLVALDYSAIREFGEGFKHIKFSMVFSLIAGWLVGISTKFPEEIEHIATGFIAGSIIINSIKDEFPKEGSNVKYKVFLISSVIYAVILILSHDFT